MNLSRVHFILERLHCLSAGTSRVMLVRGPQVGVTLEVIDEWYSCLALQNLAPH